jgi:regulatory protein
MDKIVTDLIIQKKNKNRINVFLDGQFAFSLSNILLSTLKIDQRLNQEEINTLIEQDEFHQASKRAEHFIGYRPRTVAEVSRKLIGLKHNKHTVNAVIQKLIGQGLVDDKRYASLWVDERSLSKPRGKKLLAIELHQKGVAPEVFQEVIDKLDERSLGLKAARDFIQKLKENNGREFKEKVTKYLLRRGFNYSEIIPIVEQVWEEKRKKYL